MSSFGFVYRWAPLYRLTMWALYRGDRARHLLVADLVPEGSSVIDLCCGDCAIASRLLAKGCGYVGLDLNPAFVRAGRRRGLDVRPWDAREVNSPEADVVLLQSSLYQFVDRDEELLHAMIDAAHQRVVISEPVKNWTSSESRMLRAVARRLTHVDGRVFDERYTEQRLRELVGRVAQREQLRFTRTERDLVVTIETGAAQVPPT